MKYLGFSLVSLLFPFSSSAQIDPCENGRYVENVFTSTTSTLNIKYGENISIGGNTIELFADVFEPANDNEPKRPLIILMHGGSYTTGERSDIHNLCEAYALKGYVVASINYRLYDGAFFPFPDSTDLGEVLIQSVGDAKAAVRFFKNDAATTNEFKIDTNIIIMGGVSAGAITALHVAHMDENDDLPNFIDVILANNGGLEGNSNNLFQHSSEVHGVINFSGALYRDHFLDANETPVFSVHDDMDGIVPYSDGFAVVVVIPIVRMNGSELVHARALNQGVESQLITYENSSGHVSYFPDDAQELVDTTAHFMANQLICQTPASSKEFIKEASHKIYPNPGQNLVYIKNSNAVDRIQVRSLTGRIVPVLYQGESLDISDLSNGIYLIELYDKNDQQINVQKLIKQ